ncbi:hypothetical protein [Streptomyces sp. NPDC050422]|uniref:hypothetical protein n=1 Tax=Streptomyces sp. NPDC050422 TaxID=3365614 RepID=UPI00378CE1AC
MPPLPAVLLIGPPRRLGRGNVSRTGVSVAARNTTCVTVRGRISSRPRRRGAVENLGDASMGRSRLRCGGGYAERLPHRVVV